MTLAGFRGGGGGTTFLSLKMYVIACNFRLFNVCFQTFYFLEDPPENHH